jgi:hypothetical protein
MGVRDTGKTMKMLFLICFSSIALFSSAYADVQIKMMPGEQCWSYQGRDSRFSGIFSGGQGLTIAFVEQYSTDDGGMKTVSYNGERVWVNGPDGYYKDGHRDPAPDDDPFIYTGKQGRYIFNLYEHGTGTQYPVFFKICATKKK